MTEVDPAARGDAGSEPQQAYDYSDEAAPQPPAPGDDVVVREPEAAPDPVETPEELLDEILTPIAVLQGSVDHISNTRLQQFREALEFTLAWWFGQVLQKLDENVNLEELQAEFAKLAAERDKGEGK